MVRSSRAQPWAPSALSCTFSARQRLAALLELLLCEVWVSEKEAEDREGEGSEEEGARMMGQVWNLHTPLAWLIPARLGWVTHYLLVEVRENVGDRRCE